MFQTQLGTDTKITQMGGGAENESCEYIDTQEEIHKPVIILY